MKVTATNKATGEVVDLSADTPEQIVDAWRVAQEYEKTAVAIKDQLKKIVPRIVDHHGLSEPIGNYQFRVSIIQRFNYDKSVMRNLMDADLFDTMLKPDKTLIDKYLKENLPDWSTELRNSMLPESKPYQVIKLEKLS